MSTGRHFDAPRSEDVARQLDRAEVRVVWYDDVRPRSERLQQRHGRCRSRRERGRCRSTFQLQQAALERRAIGILVARVEISRAIAPVGFAREGRGEMDRRCHGGRRRIDVVAGVHGNGLDTHVAGSGKQVKREAGTTENRSSMI